MDSILYENYLNILRQELVPALGCTEPIAIAYTAAKARQILGEFPDSVEMELSGNIIKNVKGVTVSEFRRNERNGGSCHSWYCRRKRR